MPTIVLVGSRDGALAAAEEMGLSVLLLAERRPPPGRREALADYARVDLRADPADLIARARSLAGRRRIAGVIALTEAAVVPAAHIRAALGLDGLDVAVARRCHDKLLMKRAVREAGIVCTDWVAVEEDTRAKDLVERLGLPVVVKPRRSSGSRGTFVAHHARALRGALEPDHLAERFVRGVEMSVESFVVEGRVVFKNHTEYHVPFWANVLPAALDRDTARAVDAVNRRAIAALGITRGITHLEVFLTERGVVFGEIAVRPPGGHLMELMTRAYGFDAWRALLEIELGRAPELPARPERFAGSWVLHPGAGVVSHVRGLRAAERAEHVDSVHCRVRRGDTVGPRLGTGNQVGHVLASARSRDEVVLALRAARELVRIDLSTGTTLDGYFDSASSSPSSASRPGALPSPSAVLGTSS